MSQKPKQQPQHFDNIIIGGGIAGVTCCEELMNLHTNGPSPSLEKQRKQLSICLISPSTNLKGVSRLQKVSSNLMDVEVAEYTKESFLQKINKKFILTDVDEDGDELMSPPSSLPQKPLPPQLFIKQGYVKDMDPSKQLLQVFDIPSQSTV